MAATKTGKKGDRTTKGTKAKRLKLGEKAIPLTRVQVEVILKEFRAGEIVAYRLPTDELQCPDVPGPDGDPERHRVPIVMVICGNTGAPKY